MTTIQKNESPAGDELRADDPNTELRRPSEQLELVAYVRVSTATQLDAYGPETQRYEIDRWCKRNNATVTLWCTDAISGDTSFTRRPGLSDALSAVVSGNAGGLIVARMDRLARKLHEQEAILSHVWSSEGARAVKTGRLTSSQPSAAPLRRVFSADTGEILRDDPDDPMRTALRQMQGVFAQLEKSLVLARLRAGKRAKREATGWAGGRPPYGWRITEAGGVLEEYPEQQAVIALAHELRATMPEYKVHEALNERGIPGPDGGAWHRSATHRILRSRQALNVPGGS